MRKSSPALIMRGFFIFPIQQKYQYTIVFAKISLYKYHLLIGLPYFCEASKKMPLYYVSISK